MRWQQPSTGPAGALESLAGARFSAVSPITSTARAASVAPSGPPVSVSVACPVSCVPKTAAARPNACAAIVAVESWQYAAATMSVPPTTCAVAVVAATRRAPIQLSAVRRTVARSAARRARFAESAPVRKGCRCAFTKSGESPGGTVARARFRLALYPAARQAHGRHRDKLAGSLWTRDRGLSTMVRTSSPAASSVSHRSPDRDGGRDETTTIERRHAVRHVTG